MHQRLALLACIGLVACQPSAPDAAETARDVSASTPAWALSADAAQVVLANQAASDGLAFALACVKAGPTLMLTADTRQVGVANLAPPFSVVLAGATFPATLGPEPEGGQTFSVTTPLTAEVLAAVRDGTSARIMVNEGYAFAESDIDSGDEFERFAADCAEFTGITARQ